MVDPSAFRSLADLVAARTELALRDDSSAEAARVLSLIAAAGVGPVLPIRLLAAALGAAGPALSLGQIRDIIVGFGSLISRGKPGTDDETLGLSHLALLDPVVSATGRGDLPPASAHQALIDAHCLMGAQPGAVHEDGVQSYWTTAAPHHYLEAGSPGAAVQFLESVDTPRAADNRNRWASWIPTFTLTIGADHPDTLRARGNLARWRGESGDVAGAVAEYEALLSDQQRVLGPDHPDTVATRDNLLHWRGKTGERPSAPSWSPEPGPPEAPPTPWYRMPAPLVAAGALGALVLALLVFAVVRISSTDSGTSPITSTVTQTVPVTETVPVTQPPQTVTETATSTITSPVTTTVTVPPTPPTVTETTTSTVTTTVTETTIITTQPPNGGPIVN